MDSVYLFEKYGYCHVPPNTKLYRRGSINTGGSYFALHPACALTPHGMKYEVDIWITKFPLKLLFLVSHLNGMGNPQTSVINLFKELVDSESPLDDLEIKGQVPEALMQLVISLEEKNIEGWLTTQENQYPLEIFLLPSSLNNICKYDNMMIKKKTVNSLRTIELFETKAFRESSKEAVLSNYEYLYYNHKEVKEGRYSLLQKLFSRVMDVA